MTVGVAMSQPITHNPGCQVVVVVVYTAVSLRGLDDYLTHRRHGHAILGFIYMISHGACTGKYSVSVL